MSARISNGRRPTTNGTPGPHGKPIPGLTRHGDFARHRTAHLTSYQVNHPEGMGRYLRENDRRYGVLARGGLPMIVGPA